MIIFHYTSTVSYDLFSRPNKSDKPDVCMYVSILSLHTSLYPSRVMYVINSEKANLWPSIFLV